jgi:hypothetical protein
MVSFLRKQWNTMPKHRNGMDAKWEAKESKIYKRIEVTRRIGCSYARILFWEQRRRKSEGVGIGGLLRVSNTGVCVWGGGVVSSYQGKTGCEQGSWLEMRGGRCCGGVLFALKAHSLSTRPRIRRRKDRWFWSEPGPHIRPGVSRSAQEVARGGVGWHGRGEMADARVVR